MSVVTPDIQKTIFACLMHAHIINAENPGSYQDTINKVFPANNLPAIITPEDPPSKRILKSMMADPQKEAETTAATQQVQEQHMEAETSTQAKKTEEPTKPKCKRKVKERKELLNSSSISSNDIGLKIYSADSRGWPEGKISEESLIKGIEEGTYMYPYTNTALKEGEVMMKIVFN